MNRHIQIDKTVRAGIDTKTMGKAASAVAADPEKRLVDRMRARLEAGYWPRVHCMLLVTLSAAS